MNGVNAFGATALHLAGEFNSVGVMELLVSAGAGLDAPNGDGWSPLMDAAFSGSIPAMELLQHWAYDSTALGILCSGFMAARIDLWQPSSVSAHECLRPEGESSAKEPLPC